MTDEEILSPPEGGTVEELAGRYAIELEVSEAELEALEIGRGDEEILDLFELADHCSIDLKHRRMIHGRRYHCIKPTEVAGVYAHRG